ncbi:hypothetical protein COO60DRAFT_337541 [Scenedesmus sp. NREL 46B-D3]|nr:hypothetical protein COO60DRAFT_337541 [Scenedesmus sp. NREL 46B-D3]
MEALSRENVMDFLYIVGMNPTPDVVDGKLRLLRLHKAATLTWGELAHVWSLLLRDAANEDRILERAFAFFDKDGNGEIDVAELRTTMSELGDLLTEEEIMAFVSIMDVDNDGVIGYQEFLSTLRSEVPKFARARASSQEDYPQQPHQQQQQQQHYLAPPSAATATLAPAADDSLASHHQDGHAWPPGAGARSHAGAGSGMQLSGCGAGACRGDTHRSVAALTIGEVDKAAAAAAHPSSRPSWHVSSEEQSHLKNLELQVPAVQHVPTWQSLLHTPRQQQQQQHSSSQQLQSPRQQQQQQQQQSPRQHKQLRAQFQQQHLEDAGCGHHPATARTGSNPGSDMELEDSLPGQAQEVGCDQPPLSSRATPRMKSSLAS